MAGISPGQHLRLRFDGQKLISLDDLELTEGQEIEVVVTQEIISPVERWRRISESLGSLEIPSDFNWNYDRDDLYRDIT